jgi:hypothetical protein
VERRRGRRGGKIPERTSGHSVGWGQLVYRTGYRRPSLCLEPIRWDDRTPCSWTQTRTCLVPISVPRPIKPRVECLLTPLQSHKIMSPHPPQEFESKSSDAVRRRLSSVSSRAKPNISGFSSLNVCPPHSFVSFFHITECIS